MSRPSTSVSIVSLSVVIIPSLHTIFGDTVPEVDASYSHTFVLGQLSTPVLPVLASMTDANGNDNANGTSLRLNMGIDAPARGNSFTADGAEDFRITHVSGVAGNETVQVTGLGFTETYAHVANILARNTGTGNDRIEVAQGVLASANWTAGSGTDQLIYAGSGASTLTAGTGNDYLVGGLGFNTFNTGSGTDVLQGKGTDVFNAGTGSALIQGSGGFETINWSTGNGPITVTGGGNASTTLNVNDGTTSDNVVLSASSGAAQLNVGASVLMFAGVSNLNLNLASGATTTIGALAGVGLTNVNLGLGSHNQADHINLQGASTNDSFILGTANSILSVYENGSITVAIIQGNASLGDTLTIHGNAGNDTIDASGVGQNLLNLALYGDSGNDKIIGSPFADVIHGGDGDDTLIGGGGADAIYGEAGNDVITGGLGSVALDGASGVNTLVFDDSAGTNLTASLNDATIIGSRAGGPALVTPYANFSNRQVLLGTGTNALTINTTSSVPTSGQGGQQRLDLGQCDRHRWR